MKEESKKGKKKRIERDREKNAIKKNTNNE